MQDKPRYPVLRGTWVLFRGRRVKILVSIIVLIMAAGATLYLRKPKVDPSSKADRIIGHRPWRRLGAAICILVSIMFVLGINVFDRVNAPRAFAWYWLTILVLLVWLCWLAFKDLLYTRHMLLNLKERLDDLDGPPSPDSPPHEDQD